MKYSKSKLKNGLTVIEVPGRDAESVVVDVFIKTGSRNETSIESGISHFLEHFLFKGTEKYPSAVAISELVDSIGGEMNASTGKEYTQYYIKAAHQHLPVIFDVLADMVQRPLFNAEELEREKGVIVEEINMYKDTPMYEIDNVLERTMWPGDPLGRDIAGTKETVTKFTPDMFRSYMSRAYQPGNMLLGISGRYQKKTLDKLIAKHFGDMPKKAFGTWTKVVDKQARARVSVEYKETEQAHLAMGFKGYSYGDKRGAAQAVLAAVLGGGMSSRLFVEVRERRGLCYYVRAGAGSYQDTGSFGVSSGVQTTKIEEAITVILGELKRIATVPVDAKELKKAKDYIKGRTTLALEDNQARLDWYLERTAFFPKVLNAQETFKKIDAVKASEVMAVAEDLFKASKLSLAIIGPYKSAEHFEKLIKI